MDLASWTTSHPPSHLLPTSALHPHPAFQTFSKALHCLVLQFCVMPRKSISSMASSGQFVLRTESLLHTDIRTSPHPPPVRPPAVLLHSTSTGERFSYLPTRYHNIDSFRKGRVPCPYISYITLIAPSALVDLLIIVIRDQLDIIPASLAR